MSDELSREFVDANVLVYAYDVSAAQKKAPAEELLARLWRDRAGCLSIQVLQEFFVTVTRKVRRPLESEQAERLVADLGCWTVHSPAVEDVLAAIELQRRHAISFWDAMVLRSASSLGCNLVWSEDLSPGQDYDGVRVVNPFAESSA